MTTLVALIGAALVSATPLLYATLGELVTERAGILNLGIEGTLYAGAFAGFLVAANTGSPWLGLIGAVVVGLLSGLLMGLLTVTFGVNQHVAGIGTTLLLIGLSEFVNRLKYGGGAVPQIEKFGLLFKDVPVLEQYLLTYIGFLVLAPVMWWMLRGTGFGLRVRAVGENPEAADAAGISVARTRYAALLLGGALTAVGGAVLTLAILGSFTLNITAGRGWVCIALVIFARWRVWPAVLGALLFAGVDALQLQLAISST
ncbi:MAG TPA: ABC transporter permease, partial [Micromonosporaceae bacterium]|nr:ABC transporter permease [Micromonosporaceae bacterium]